MTPFPTKIFDEPELEFGDRHHHPDPRLGLMDAGPLQTFVGDVIKVAVVGSAKTSPQAVATAMEFYKSVGKRPIHIKKEVRGHVANRNRRVARREYSSGSVARSDSRDQRRQD